MEKRYLDQETINLILNFYTFTQGYWEHEIPLYTEIQKFVKDGYTCYHDDYPELIIPTKEGYNYLHCRIEEISQKYIHFMMQNGMECGKEKVIEWFTNEFNLDELENGEEIAKYISDNLYHYGYKGFRSSSRRKGKPYSIVKMK